MLKSLFIKDYALIDLVTIEFGTQLNIITGETGAGKSILLDAISLILGERASVDSIRTDAEKAVVEAIFDIDSTIIPKDLIESNEADWSDELIIRREITRKGTTRCFVNDSPVQVATLKKLGEVLVDLHGQHDHQSLLRKETHLSYLDSFGNYGDIIINYKKVYSEHRKLELKIRELKAKEKQIKEKQDFYRFQLKEIEGVNPIEGEDEQIESELSVLENAEKLLELSDSLYAVLYDGDASVNDLLHNAKGSLQEIARYDKSLEELKSELESASVSVKYVSDTIRNYKGRISLDPEELENMRERLSVLTLLKKKYGQSLKSIIDYKDKISEELLLADKFDSSLEDLEAERELLQKQCIKSGQALSQKRKDAAINLASEIETYLRDLGIVNPNFEVKIESTGESDGTVKLLPTGIDEVEFMMSTNAGENIKPLVKVASGGEVSRIMLSLKSALAENDPVGLMVFDEIDTGVSGRIARKVGLAVKALSKKKQIITITHLPQIAALSDSHYVVEKFESEGRIKSKIRLVDIKEKTEEVAKLLSGESVTANSLETALELINSNE